MESLSSSSSPTVTWNWLTRSSSLMRSTMNLTTERMTRSALHVCQINKLFSDKTESLSSVCRRRNTLSNDTKFPVFRLLRRNLFCNSSIFCSNVFHCSVDLGCEKLNDKKLFQNGSLGVKISLLTSLFKCSFLDNSSTLLLVAPILLSAISSY